MQVGDSIFSFLTADGGVSGIVGQRVSPGVMPQGQPVPAIVYTVIINQPLQVLEGSSDVRRAIVQLDCYAKHYRQVQGLADAVEAAFATLSTLAPFPRAIQRRREDVYDDPSEFFHVRMEYSYWTTV